MAPAKRFMAVLGGEDRGIPLVELPFDVRATFGSARPKVKVTVNGVELRTTVAVYGGKSYVGFRKEIREAAGIAPGDRVRLTVEADTEERVVEVPDDLARALARDKVAKKAFDALSFSHKNEYARWIAEAKKAETRERRVTKAVAMVREGKKKT